MIDTLMLLLVTLHFFFLLSFVPLSKSKNKTDTMGNTISNLRFQANTVTLIVSEEER